MPTRSVVVSVLVAACAAVLSGAPAAAQGTSGPGLKTGAPGVGAIEGAAGAQAGTKVLELSPATAAALRNGSGTLRVDRVPIADADRTLTLERFEVFAPDVQFVVARRGGWERIETPKVAFWRGAVEGEAGSSVFILSLIHI